MTGRKIKKWRRTVSSPPFAHARSLAEYLIHRGCHAFRIHYHLDHHRTPFLRYDPSFAPYLASAAGLYLLPRFWLLWLALAKYQLSHTLSHY